MEYVLVLVPYLLLANNKMKGNMCLWSNIYTTLCEVRRIKTHYWQGICQLKMPQINLIPADPLPRDGYVLVSSRLIIVKLKEIKKHRCPNKITQRQIIPACT